jgi:hypothetical protein
VTRLSYSLKEKRELPETAGRGREERKRERERETLKAARQQHNNTHIPN